MIESVLVSPATSQQLHAELSQFAALLDAPEGESVPHQVEWSVEVAQAYDVLAQRFTRLVPATLDDVPLFDATYLDAMLNSDSVGRTAFIWFLDLLLGQTLSLASQPHEHTLSIGIFGAAEMRASPYQGSFVDTAPLAAWIARETGVAPESVGILAEPFHPDEATVGLSALVSSVLTTRNPELLATSNQTCPFMAALPDNDGTEPFPLVFLTTLYLKDADEVERVREGLAQHHERMCQDDADDRVCLPYQVVGGDGGTDTTEVSNLYITLPFSALADNAFSQQQDALDDAIAALLPPDDAVLAPDGANPAGDPEWFLAKQIGMHLRSRNRINWAETRHWYFELYDIASGVVLFDSPGVQLKYAGFYTDAMRLSAEAWGLGEIRMGAEIVYPAPAAPAQNPAA